MRVRPYPARTLPTYEAARLVEADLVRRRALGDLYVEEPITLGEAIDEWLDRRVALGGRNGPLRPATVSWLRDSARSWAGYRDLPLPRVTRALVEDHIAARAKKTPTAARNELQLLKAVLRSAQARGQRVDPGVLSARGVRVEHTEARALEPDEVDAITAWMPEHVRRIVPLLASVGLRIGEALGLEDGMLDLAEARLTVPRELNKSRRRKQIPLSPGEVRLLREQLLARTPGTRLVFPTKTGRRYSKSGFYSVWSRACRRAGVGRVRVHWLRHTAISLMARAGIPPEVIAIRVGHSDGGALIMRRYRHVYPSEIADTVARIDTLLAAPADGSRGRSVDRNQR